MSAGGCLTHDDPNADRPPRAAARDPAPVAPTKPQAPQVAIGPAAPLELPAAPETQPKPTSSSGSLVLPGIRASRFECVSPCAVMFSIDAIEDPNDDNPFAHVGVHWDYGDATADERWGPYTRGAAAKRGEKVTRESDTNTPLGMHVYGCEQGTCTFHPGVAVSNAAGDWATAWSTITVHAASQAFPKERTVCVSSAGAWDGDVPCPPDAVQARALPKLGEWQDDTRYLLRRGESFETERSCIGYGRRDILVTSFGNAADPKPALTRMAIGRERSCSNAATNDETLAGYRPTRWNENITLADLRVEELAVGMTFEDITFHDVDMDFERAPRGGGISSTSTDRCTKDPKLSCEKIPLPKGLYISSARIIGSRADPPGLNIGLMRSTCASFVGVIDTELRVAAEHNMRVECSSRVLAIHGNFNGEHLGRRGKISSGRKSAITVRPDGSLAQDMLGKQRMSTKDRKRIFESRYTVIKDMRLGSPQSINNSSPITIAPTKAADPEVTRFAVVSGNRTELSGGSGDGPATFDARLAGSKLVCYDDNVWETKRGCADHGPQSIPAGGYDQAETKFAAPVVPDAPASYRKP